MPLPPPNFFESIMLICFGCSWPFAIAKTIRTRNVEGKSVIFIGLIFIGYLSGIVFKLIGRFDQVIWLYATNGSLVFVELVLYFRYNRRQIRAARPAGQKIAPFMDQLSRLGSSGPNTFAMPLQPNSDGIHGKEKHSRTCQFPREGDRSIG